MTKKKRVLLALAQEVVALYGGQVVSPPEILLQAEGQALRPGSGQVQPTRKLTTGETFDGRKFVSSLRLQGQWLEQAGFPAGTKVIVQVQEGEIVLLGCRKGEQRESEADKQG